MKYADDTTIYTMVEKKDTTTVDRTTIDHCVSLPHNSVQEATTEVVTWSNNNSMRLNINKTKSMFVSLRGNISCSRPIVLNGVSVENVAVFKLHVLGIHIDNHLKFDTHVDITSNAMSKHMRVSH